MLKMFDTENIAPFKGRVKYFWHHHGVRASFWFPKAAPSSCLPGFSRYQTWFFLSLFRRQGNNSDGPQFACLGHAVWPSQRSTACSRDADPHYQSRRDLVFAERRM